MSQNMHTLLAIVAAPDCGGDGTSPPECSADCQPLESHRTHPVAGERRVGG